MLTAIILAAGSSQRMGSNNKLLLAYKNRPVVAEVVKNILSAGITDIVVVLGFEAEKIKYALDGLGMRFVYNGDYVTGMTSSIREGVRAAKGSGYMICLSDLVRITPEEYSLLAKTFTDCLRQDAKCICLPKYRQQKGNPVIFSEYYRQAILDHDDPEGCKAIVESHKEHICIVEMAKAHILQDLDYPEDYKNLQLEADT